MQKIKKGLKSKSRHFLLHAARKDGILFGFFPQNVCKNEIIVDKSRKSILFRGDLSTIYRSIPLPDRKGCLSYFAAVLLSAGAAVLLSGTSLVSSCTVVFTLDSM